MLTPQSVGQHTIIIDASPYFTVNYTLTVAPNNSGGQTGEFELTTADMTEEVNLYLPLIQNE